MRVLKVVRVGQWTLVMGCPEQQVGFWSPPWPGAAPWVTVISQPHWPHRYTSPVTSAMTGPPEWCFAPCAPTLEPFPWGKVKEATTPEATTRLGCLAVKWALISQMSASFCCPVWHLLETGRLRERQSRAERRPAACWRTIPECLTLSGILVPVSDPGWRGGAGAMMQGLLNSARRVLPLVC